MSRLQQLQTCHACSSSMGERTVQASPAPLSSRGEEVPKKTTWHADTRLHQAVAVSSKLDVRGQVGVRTSSPHEISRKFAAKGQLCVQHTRAVPLVQRTPRLRAPLECTAVKTLKSCDTCMPAHLGVDRRSRHLPPYGVQPRLDRLQLRLLNSGTWTHCAHA